MDKVFQSWQKIRMKKLAMICLLGLTSCTHFTQLTEPPKVTLQQVQLQNATLTEADLNISLNVENPNKVEVLVKNLKYSIDVNNKHLTSGNLQQEIRIAAQGNKDLTVPLKLKYSDVMASALKFFDSGGLPYHIKGSVDIGPFNVPFNENGTLKASEMK